MNELVELRKVDGAEVWEILNSAAISERFFNRSRAWFTQRLNNNAVNGKPVSFTPEELHRLRNALKSLASEITHFANNIPNIPTAMKIKIFVIDDRVAIDYIQNGDLKGFKEYIASDSTIDFGEPEYFDTEAEALAFCAGLGYGMDERGVPERYPLRSCEDSNTPFIQQIEMI